jgi:hypothetical protein
LSLALDREAKVKEVAIRKSLLLKEKCKRDSLFWLKTYAKTFDEHDKENPIKPFPVRPYVPPIINEIEAEQIVHIAKSRQMSMSWLAISWLLHEAQFFNFRLEAVFSKKEEDAYALVERAKFVYNYQPLWLKNLCPLDRKMRDMPYGHIYFANGSKIRGFAQGKDQIRSYVPSTALIDEAAFQDKMEETYGACVPCCQKIITISSANPGYFERLCDLKPQDVVEYARAAA